MSNYLVELAAVHVALMLGYWFFLRRERQYTKIRFYLIGATLLALIIPLFKLPRLFGSNEPEAIPVETISLEAVTIAPTAETSAWPEDMIIWVYLGISAFFLLKCFGNMLYIVYLEHNSSYEKFNSLFIRKVKNVEGSFTFFNWIFLNEKITKNHPEYGAILKHEQAHTLMGHSYDILFFELFKACFWWLPTSWYICKEIKKIHEYQADAYALESYTLDHYSSILISSTLKSNGLSLASSFHDGLILKRLIAMKQQAKNVSPWKLGALMALGSLLFVVFACTEEMDQEIQQIGSQSNTITFDQLPEQMQADLAVIKGALSFMKVDVPEGEALDNLEELQDLDPELIHSINVNKDRRVIYVALKKDGANFDYLANKSKTAGDVFTVVEEQPEFEGGMDAFYQYIASEMQYPLQAREQGVEGRIFVQFTVEKDGLLTDVQAVKGIGAGCDEEAVRVLAQAPRWKPGKQRGKPVRVRMVMPITFKLGSGKTDKDNSSAISVDKVEVINNQLQVNVNYADGAWSGTVYAEDGNGFPGANIVVAGTNTGTVSDLEGKFRVKAEESSDLYISAVGYEQVKVDGK